MKQNFFSCRSGIYIRILEHSCSEGRHVFHNLHSQNIRSSRIASVLPSIEYTTHIPIKHKIAAPTVNEFYPSMIPSVRITFHRVSMREGFSKENLAAFPDKDTERLPNASLQNHSFWIQQIMIPNLSEIHLNSKGFAQLEDDLNRKYVDRFN